MKKCDASQTTFPNVPATRVVPSPEVVLHITTAIKAYPPTPY